MSKSGWTIETLKAHFDELRKSDKQAIDAALAAAEKAVQKAEMASERRFEGVNEFRQTLSDQAGTFATKDAVNALTSRFDRQEGTGKGLHQGWGYLVGAVGIGIALWKTVSP
jgi:hypothetical protein